MTEHCIERIAGKGTMHAAAEEFLRCACLEHNWQYAELWRMDPAERAMRWLACYSASPAVHEPFIRFSKLCKLAPGMGLIGKALVSDKPVWMKVQDNKEFFRGDLSLKPGFAYGGAIMLSGMFVLSVFTNDQAAVKPALKKLLKVRTEIAAALNAYQSPL